MQVELLGPHRQLRHALDDIVADGEIAERARGAAVVDLGGEKHGVADEVSRRRALNQPSPDGTRWVSFPRDAE